MDISELKDYPPYSVVVIMRNGKRVNLNLQDYQAARDGEILLAYRPEEHTAMARAEAGRA